MLNIIKTLLSWYVLFVPDTGWHILISSSLHGGQVEIVHGLAVRVQHPVEELLLLVQGVPEQKL